jgi:hypothetical protein
LLKQSEADRQVSVPKIVVPKPLQGHSALSTVIDFRAGTDLVYPLYSTDLLESFYLDLYRPTKNPAKLKVQLRAISNDILVRLDVNGSPHRNPDHVRKGKTHLHTYREGDGDDWAETLDPALFSNPNDPARAFADFCRYCNITISLIGIHV